MTLADRLNKIIDEKNISKREFAKQVGIPRIMFIRWQAKVIKSQPFRQCSQRSLQWSSAMMPSGSCMEIKRYDKSRMSLNAHSAFSVTVWIFRFKLLKSMDFWRIFRMLLCSFLKPPKNPFLTPMRSMGQTSENLSVYAPFRQFALL